MSKLSKKFVRFPHRCVIYSMTGETSFSDGEREVLWEGRCRKESNTSKRVFLRGSQRTTGQVIVSQFGLQLGALVGGDLMGDTDAAYDGGYGDECGAVVHGIRPGMQVDVTDAQGTLEHLIISDAYCGNLGTTVYFENSDN
jgi:hypothetical protein